jgi:plastocyanin
MGRLSFLCLAVLAALAISACGGTTASNAPASQSAAASSAPSGSAAAACATAGVGDAGATVEIKDFKFTPDQVTAKVGDIVAWTNQDSTGHTATLVDGSCGTDTLATGITGALVFGVAGTYPYQCKIHPDRMKGTITITQ